MWSRFDANQQPSIEDCDQRKVWRSLVANDNRLEFISSRFQNKRCPGLCIQVTAEAEVKAE
jgi:hypothetical protein